LALFISPYGRLYLKLQIVLAQEVQQPLVIETQRRPGPKDIPYGIPEEQWPKVLARVENHESDRKLARDDGVSRETIRRLVYDESKKTTG
jgi:hypothetical protein